MLMVLRSKAQVMDALDTEALDFVGCCLCMCMGFAYSTLELVHDSADDGTALSLTFVSRLSVDRDDN